MTYCLSSKDIWAFGFMTFASSRGAEDTISPSMVNLKASERVWNADAALLLTAVELDTCAGTVSVRGLA
ncbi:branched-chain amino acid transport system II carrier protein [Xenorhabdus stockiae]|uniref:Branched-chain amino acid transport system carrier protein n=1 Tax=Xenorhabdus stockiae TaxID=351614 RepID=A0A2D0KT16_9GAMM|nr:branched-chain amino acid transport system II carrier protein [Xenorhabdus stockiae]PHM66347.1 branched-chain amino acid transport system II carrier protein [Xenorhabdus stockiae]